MNISVSNFKHNANLANKPIGFIKPSLSKRIALGVCFTAAAYFSFDSFTSRYTFMIDYTGYRCLDARFFIVDKQDKTFSPGDIIAIDGAGVPILPDENKYIKMVAGVAGQTVTFKNHQVSNGEDFKRYAPVSDEYLQLKKKHNLKTEWQLGPKEIFLIGDTIHSLDARVVGPSNSDYVIGKAYVLF